MATATKPKPADASLLREAEADREHLGRIAAAAMHARTEVELFFSYGGSAARPTPLVREAVFNIYRVIAERPSQSWPMNSWPLLATLGRMVDSFHSIEVYIGNPTHPWPFEILMRQLVATAEACDLIINPPVEKPPETIELESFAELREQRVSEQQQCKIYSVLDSNGNADVPALRRLKEERGEAFRPKWVRPARRDARIPESRPRCSGAVLDFASLLETIAVPTPHESPMPSDAPAVA